MPSRLLTDRLVESVKPTPGKRRDYFDAKVPGLVLRVTEQGVKTWVVRYRHRGRSQRVKLADVTVLSLADARERAREVLRDASKGANPAADKQNGRHAQTIADLAELYITKWAKPKKRSWKADDNLLRRKVLPRWQHRAIVDIKRQDVRLLVEQVAEAGAPIVANRVAALISKMFAFALDRELVEASPAMRIARPGQEHARDRVLAEDELRSVWRSFEALETSMGAYYKLRLLTAQRGGEVASMRWQDIDVESGWWTIPSIGSKNKLAHRVPLARCALTLVAALLATARDESIFVLAGARGKRQQSEAAATIEVPDFRGHDLRRTAASLMTGGGISRIVVGKILNHAERGVTAVYDRHSYDAEKRAALDWWDRKVVAIVSGESSGSKVLPFATAAHAG